MTWLLAIELHWECHTGVLPPDALDLPISQRSHDTFASAVSPWVRLGRSKMFRSTLRSGALTFGCVLASALGSTAGAELLNHKDLSASIAITIAQTAMETCKTNGYAVSVTVVGRNGEIIVQVRGDGTGPHTVENSMRKAYTSRTFRIPSGDMVQRLKDNPQLGLIHLSNVIANQGALPIKVGEETIGAAGASGAPGGEKDEACGKAGTDKVAGLPEQCRPD